MLVEHARLDGGRQQVVGRGDGVDIARQVQVELLHRHHLFMWIDWLIDLVYRYVYMYIYTYIYICVCVCGWVSEWVGGGGGGCVARQMEL